MEQPTLISFVRHGDVHNPCNIVYGRLPDYRLSEKGIEQAHSVGRYFAGEPLAAVISSPLLRARQTAAAILANHPHLAMQRSALINEVYTMYQCSKVEEMNARRWDVYTGTPPPYEQPADLAVRLAKFVARMRRRYPGGHVVAVSHGDPILYFSLWVNGLPVDFEHSESLAYPDKVSFTTLTYSTAKPDERPGYAYIQPQV